MEEDERREAAIASAASSLHNRPNGLTSSQLSKFQELHRRRLKIKEKSKLKKKNKGFNGMNGKSKEADVVTEECKNDESSLPSEKQGKVELHPGTNKRQKLYWGLDTKERWEMKANM